ncbi:MAG: hypothetical protein QGG48_00365, partial [Desulfatiglandales bacterium]|nr:hypothetical protein [Desulfatiglandales bacterium]
NGSVNVKVENSPNVGSGDGSFFHDVNLQYDFSLDIVDFGSIFVGEELTLEINISNIGTDILVVEDIGINNSDFSVNNNSFNVIFINGICCIFFFSY